MGSGAEGTKGERGALCVRVPGERGRRCTYGIAGRLVGSERVSKRETSVGGGLREGAGDRSWGLGRAERVMPPKGKEGDCDPPRLSLVH